MYSSKIEKILKTKKIKPGDKVVVSKDKVTYQGLLLPKTDSGDPDCLVLKLDSGYNVGIKSLDIKKLKSVNKDFGKVKKSLLKLKFNSKLPPIALVASGGTIASRVDYRTGGVYALEDPREFLHNVPELGKIVNIKTISKPVTRMSEDLGYKDWILLAKDVHKQLKNHKGVVITHGTDTLHYTSAALSFFLKGLNKPVVLVGAQKSPDRGSSDAGINLICASHLAKSDIAEVGTCMHGSINDDYCLFIRGTKVKKMNTVRRDAFRPINDLPLAKISPEGKLDVMNKKYNKRSKGSTTLDIKYEPKVALLKVYPSSDPGIIDYYIKKGYKGFVIEGTGLGHVPTFADKSWIKNIKSATNSGIPVVMTSQTVYGRVNPRVYTNLRILYQDAGAIPAEDMLSETAYVKLGHVLGHTKVMEKVKKEMLTNYAGEITERSLQKTFLY